MVSTRVIPHLSLLTQYSFSRTAPGRHYLDVPEFAVPNVTAAVLP